MKIINTHTHNTVIILLFTSFLKLFFLDPNNDCSKGSVNVNLGLNNKQIFIFAGVMYLKHVT